MSDVPKYIPQTGGYHILSTPSSSLQELQPTSRPVRGQRRSRGEALEAESKQAQVGLCATPFGVDVVGITETVALVGAVVSGVSARRRKNEVEVTKPGERNARPLATL